VGPPGAIGIFDQILVVPSGEVLRRVLQHSDQGLERRSRAAFGQYLAGIGAQPASQHFGARESRAGHDRFEQLSVIPIHVDLKRFANSGAFGSHRAVNVIHVYYTCKKLDQTMRIADLISRYVPTSWIVARWPPARARRASRVTWGNRSLRIV
jgi:hypothetical protein